jgi:hypothetical protein
MSFQSGHLAFQGSEGLVQKMLSARKNLFGRGGREGERQEEDAITINDHTVRKCAL